MNFPSVKKILTIPKVEKHTAEKVRCCMLAETRDALIDLAEIYGCAKTIKRVNSCYNPPRSHEVAMAMIDELLETCGVEAFQLDESDESGSYDNYVSYCNTGDTYAPTVCYHAGRYYVASWGDLAEKWGAC